MPQACNANAVHVKAADPAQGHPQLDGESHCAAPAAWTSETHLPAAFPMLLGFSLTLALGFLVTNNAKCLALFHCLSSTPTLS